MRLSGPSPIAPVPLPAPAPAVAGSDPQTGSGAPLDPAVRLDIRADDPARTATAPRQDAAAAAAAKAGETPRVFIDTATKTLVYQVLNPASGEVVFQLPDPFVLKVRGYEAAQARSAAAMSQTLDRTA